MSEPVPSKKKLVLDDLGYAFLFGLLSVVLGLVQFKIPGFENSYSDLREIPLLISIFYLRHSIFVLVTSLLTLIATPEGVPYSGNFLMHFIPLFIIWYVFRWIEKKKLHNLLLGSVWGITTLAYYHILLFPVLIISYQLAGYNTSLTFVESYKSIVHTSLFEIITTTLITSLFLIQHDVRKNLEYNNLNLEKIVRQRTIEITSANQELQSLNEELTALNEELVASNEEVKSLNENLERIVIDRTEKINSQLKQLSRYAHMNSHEVRAPLARMLGILGLLKIETDQDLRIDLLNKLFTASEELDLVIREMNRLLEKEIPDQY